MKMKVFALLNKVGASGGPAARFSPAGGIRRYSGTEGNCVGAGRMRGGPGLSFRLII